MHIIVKDIINTNFAVSAEDGNTIFELLNNNFSKGNIVSLDFNGITLMTTAFLNSAIGQLYSTENYSGEFLNEKLNLENVQKHDLPLFSIVIKRAKEYFANKKDFEKNSEDTIYGKD